MGKFHISKKGKVEPCTATTKACPLGGLHVEADTVEGAVEVINKEYAKSHSILAGMKNEPAKDKFDKKIEDFINEIENDIYDEAHIIEIDDEYEMEAQKDYIQDTGRDKVQFYSVKMYKNGSLQDEDEMSEYNLKYDLKDYITNYKKEQEKPRVFNETSRYNLEARYDSRKSFGGKASISVDEDTGDKKLYSYGTHVASIERGKPAVYNLQSSTTQRHVKEFLKQNEFFADSLKQMKEDYFVKEGE